MFAVGLSYALYFVEIAWVLKCVGKPSLENREAIFLLQREKKLYLASFKALVDFF